MIAFASLLRLLLPIPSALAVADPCAGLAVLGCGASPDFQNFVIVQVPKVLLPIGGAAAVFFIVWGGAQMLLNLGDEGTMSKGRVCILNGILGLILVLTAQSIVSFVGYQATAFTISDNVFVDYFLIGVRIIRILMNGAFAAIMVYAGFRMVIAHGQSDQFGKAKTALIGAIAGAIVINVAYSVADAVIGLGL